MWFRLSMALLVCVGAGFLVSWFLILRNSILPILPLTLRPADLGLTAETVIFRASDGVTLHGWLLRQPDRHRPVIILCHGMAANRSDVLPLAHALYRGGYQAFLFDFRAHGESGGRVTSFGWTEQRDAEAACRWLRADAALADVAWGMYGLSMGGAVALQTAAHTAEIRAVVVDSTYKDLQSSMLLHVRLMYHMPSKPLWPWLATAYWLRYRAWPTRVSPMQAARRMDDRALFIISGTLDPRIPAEDAEAIYAAAAGPKELWIIPGAVHAGGYVLSPGEHADRVLAFFRQHLPFQS